MTLLTAVVHQRRVYCRERVDNWFLEEELTAEKTLFNTQQSLIDVNQVYQFWKVHWHQFQMLEKLEKQRCWEVNALACEVTIMWRQCKWDTECLESVSLMCLPRQWAAVVSGELQCYQLTADLACRTLTAALQHRLHTDSLVRRWGHSHVIQHNYSDDIL